MRSCQDVSAAGKRAGIKDGTRSGLWAVFAQAIDALRPQYVVIENVRGLLSAAAHRTVEDDAGDYLEPDPSGVGDGAGRPVLRAAGAVLGDLADLGHDAQWATVAASDVGAPHRRERVFIVAHPADRQPMFSAGDVGDYGRQGQSESLDKPRIGAGDRDSAGDSAPRVQLLGRGARCEPHDSAHSPRIGWDEGRAEPARVVGGFDAAISGDEHGVALLPTPVSRDGKDTHSSQRMAEKSKLTGIAHLLPTPRSSDTNSAGQHGDGGMDLRTTVTLLPTPKAQDGEFGTPRTSGRPIEKSTHLGTIASLEQTSHWGKYEPAIRRWEQVTGQPAPAPTEPNKNGNPRLSAEFSSWLMGWPPGWVTDPAIGISRNDQLRCVGNGVVSLQAAAAIRYLLAVQS